MTHISAKELKNHKKNRYLDKELSDFDSDLLNIRRGVITMMCHAKDALYQIEEVFPGLCGFPFQTKEVFPSYIAGNKNTQYKKSLEEIQDSLKKLNDLGVKLLKYYFVGENDEHYVLGERYLNKEDEAQCAYFVAKHTGYREEDDVMPGEKEEEKET